MKESLERYWAAIVEGRARPLVCWDGSSDQLLFDPSQAGVPLTLLSFEGCRLRRDGCRRETGEREHAVVLVEGRLEAEVGGQVFAGERRGGPFGKHGITPTCALYVPRQREYTLRGDGEAVIFGAPALGQADVRFIEWGDAPASRGVATWRRDIVNLVRPGETSTNLVVGETYSPAGLWSGTPPHRHDRDDPAAGESDHEEVYYFRVQHDTPAPAGVQFLSHDGVELAWPVRDRSAAAIPGGLHPVVAGPAGDLLYVWGMAGRSGAALGMRDVPGAALLKDVESALRGEDATLDERGQALLRSLRREFGAREGRG